jgi:dihydrofolate reductase
MNITETKPSLCLIVAMARNHVIGADNDLPWHLPEDLKRFKTITIGKPVILGRKTFESITSRLGKPLPGRTHYVVTRNERPVSWTWPDVTCYESLEIAIATAKHDYPKQDIMIIGGASIYEHAIYLVDTMYLTILDIDVTGDAHFPKIDDAIWTIRDEEYHPDASIPHRNITYTRR